MMYNWNVQSFASNGQFYITELLQGLLDSSPSFRNLNSRTVFIDLFD